MSEKEIVRSTRGLKTRKLKGRAGLFKKVSICLASIICCISFVAIGVLASLTEVTVTIENDLHYYATAFNKNDDDYFIIKDYDDLVTMSTLVNGGAIIPDTITTDNTAGLLYRNAKFLLLNDIVAPENSIFTPIGTNTNPFSGEFYGNGKTISGLTIDTQSSYIGLFGYVSGTKIQSVGLGTPEKPESNTINIGSGNNPSAGGLVGFVADTNDEANKTVIQNCYNYSSITTASSGKYGGLVGNIAGNTQIINCYNAGNITVQLPSGATGVDIAAGGLVGTVALNSTTLNSCYNVGSIKSNVTTGTVTYGAIVARQTSNSIASGSDNLYYLTGCAPSNSAINGETGLKALGRNYEKMSGETVTTSADCMPGLAEAYLSQTNTDTLYFFPQLKVFDTTHEADNAPETDAETKENHGLQHHFHMYKSIDFSNFFHTFLANPYASADNYLTHSSLGSTLTLQGMGLVEGNETSVTHTTNCENGTEHAIDEFELKINTDLTISYAETNKVAGFKANKILLIPSTASYELNNGHTSYSVYQSLLGASTVINIIDVLNLTATAVISNGSPAITYNGDGKFYTSAILIYSPAEVDLKGNILTEATTDGTNTTTSNVGGSLEVTDSYKITEVSPYAGVKNPYATFSLTNGVFVNGSLTASANGLRVYHADFENSNGSDKHVITITATAPKPGYKFIGFYTDTIGGTKISDATSLDAIVQASSGIELYVDGTAYTKIVAIYQAENIKITPHYSLNGAPCNTAAFNIGWEATDNDDNTTTVQLGNSLSVTGLYATASGTVSGSAQSGCNGETPVHITPSTLAYRGSTITLTAKVPVQSNYTKMYNGIIFKDFSVKIGESLYIFDGTGDSITTVTIKNEDYFYLLKTVQIPLIETADSLTGISSATSIDVFVNYKTPQVINLEVFGHTLLQTSPGVTLETSLAGRLAVETQSMNVDPNNAEFGRGHSSGYTTSNCGPDGGGLNADGTACNQCLSLKNFLSENELKFEARVYFYPQLGYKLIGLYAGEVSDANKLIDDDLSGMPVPYIIGTLSMGADLNDVSDDGLEFSLVNGGSIVTNKIIAVYEVDNVTATFSSAINTDIKSTGDGAQAPTSYITPLATDAPTMIPQSGTGNKGDKYGFELNHGLPINMLSITAKQATNTGVKKLSEVNITNTTITTSQYGIITLTANTDQLTGYKFVGFIDQDGNIISNETTIKVKAINTGGRWFGSVLTSNKMDKNGITYVLLNNTSTPQNASQGFGNGSTSADSNRLGKVYAGYVTIGEQTYTINSYVGSNFGNTNTKPFITIDGTDIEITTISGKDYIPYNGTNYEVVYNHSDYTIYASTSPDLWLYSAYEEGYYGESVRYYTHGAGSESNSVNKTNMYGSIHALYEQVELNTNFNKETVYETSSEINEVGGTLTVQEHHTNPNTSVYGEVGFTSTLSNKSILPNRRTYSVYLIPGQTFTLTATANPGYKFVGFYSAPFTDESHKLISTNPTIEVEATIRYIGGNAELTSSTVYLNDVTYCICYKIVNNGSDTYDYVYARFEADNVDSTLHFQVGVKSNNATDYTYSVAHIGDLAPNVSVTGSQATLTAGLASSTLTSNCSTEAVHPDNSIVTSFYVANQFTLKAPKGGAGRVFKGFKIELLNSAGEVSKIFEISATATDFNAGENLYVLTYTIPTEELTGVTGSNKLVFYAVYDIINTYVEVFAETVMTTENITSTTDINSLITNGEYFLTATPGRLYGVSEFIEEDNTSVNLGNLVSFVEHSDSGDSGANKGLAFKARNSTEDEVFEFKMYAFMYPSYNLEGIYYKDANDNLVVFRDDKKIYNNYAGNLLDGVTNGIFTCTLQAKIQGDGTKGILGLDDEDKEVLIKQLYFIYSYRESKSNIQPVILENNPDIDYSGEYNDGTNFTFTDATDLNAGTVTITGTKMDVKVSEKVMTPYNTELFSGSGMGNLSYVIGSKLTLSATANLGYEFVGFYGDVYGDGSYYAPCEVGDGEEFVLVDRSGSLIKTSVPNQTTTQTLPGLYTQYTSASFASSGTAFAMLYGVAYVNGVPYVVNNSYYEGYYLTNVLNGSDSTSVQDNKKQEANSQLYISIGEEGNKQKYNVLKRENGTYYVLVESTEHEVYFYNAAFSGIRSNSSAEWVSIINPGNYSVTDIQTYIAITYVLESGGNQVSIFANGVNNTSTYNIKAVYRRTGVNSNNFVHTHNHGVVTSTDGTSCTVNDHVGAGGTITATYNGTTTATTSCVGGKADGSCIFCNDLKYGSTVTFTQTPNSGFTFNGWYTADGDFISNAQSLNATVVFNLSYPITSGVVSITLADGSTVKGVLSDSSDQRAVHATDGNYYRVVNLAADGNYYLTYLQVNGVLTEYIYAGYEKHIVKTMYTSDGTTLTEGANATQNGAEFIGDVTLKVLTSPVSAFEGKSFSTVINELYAPQNIFLPIGTTFEIYVNPAYGFQIGGAFANGVTVLTIDLDKTSDTFGRVSLNGESIFVVNSDETFKPQNADLTVLSVDVNFMPESFMVQYMPNMYDNEGNIIGTSGITQTVTDNFQNLQYTIEKEGMTFLDQIFIRPGYNFLGWDTDPNATVPTYLANEIYYWSADAPDVLEGGAVKSKVNDLYLNYSNYANGYLNWNEVTNYYPTYLKTDADALPEIIYLKSSVLYAIWEATEKYTFDFHESEDKSFSISDTTRFNLNLTAEQVLASASAEKKTALKNMLFTSTEVANGITDDQLKTALDARLTALKDDSIAPVKNAYRVGNKINIANIIEYAILVIPEYQTFAEKAGFKSYRWYFDKNLTDADLLTALKKSELQADGSVNIITLTTDSSLKNEEGYLWISFDENNPIVTKVNDTTFKIDFYAIYEKIVKLVYGTVDSEDSSANLVETTDEYEYLFTYTTNNTTNVGNPDKTVTLPEVVQNNLTHPYTANYSFYGVMLSKSGITEGSTTAPADVITLESGVINTTVSSETTTFYTIWKRDVIYNYISSYATGLPMSYASETITRYYYKLLYNQTETLTDSTKAMAFNSGNMYDIEFVGWINNVTGIVANGTNHYEAGTSYTYNTSTLNLMAVYKGAITITLANPLRATTFKLTEDGVNLADSAVTNKTIVKSPYYYFTLTADKQKEVRSLILPDVATFSFNGSGLTEAVYGYSFEGWNTSLSPHWTTTTYATINDGKAVKWDRFLGDGLSRENMVQYEVGEGADIQLGHSISVYPVWRYRDQTAVITTPNEDNSVYTEVVDADALKATGINRIFEATTELNITNFSYNYTSMLDRIYSLVNENNEDGLYNNRVFFATPVSAGKTTSMKFDVKRSATNNYASFYLYVVVRKAPINGEFKIFVTDSNGVTSQLTTPVQNAQNQEDATYTFSEMLNSTMTPTEYIAYCIEITNEYKTIEIQYGATAQSNSNATFTLLCREYKDVNDTGSMYSAFISSPLGVDGEPLTGIGPMGYKITKTGALTYEDITHTYFPGYARYITNDEECYIIGWNLIDIKGKIIKTITSKEFCELTIDQENLAYVRVTPLLGNTPPEFEKLEFNAEVNSGLVYQNGYTGTGLGKRYGYAKNGENVVYVNTYNSTIVNHYAKKGNVQFNGWWTQPYGGELVIDASQNLQPNVANWTDANGTWAITDDCECVLYAHFIYELVICNNNDDPENYNSHKITSINNHANITANEIPSANITAGTYATYTVDGITHYKIYYTIERDKNGNFIANHYFLYKNTVTGEPYVEINALTVPQKTSWLFNMFAIDINSQLIPVTESIDNTVANPETKERVTFEEIITGVNLEQSLSVGASVVVTADYTADSIRVELLANATSVAEYYKGGTFPDGTTYKTVYSLRYGVSDEFYTTADCTFKVDPSSLVLTKSSPDKEIYYTFDGWYTPTILTDPEDCNLYMVLNSSGGINTSPLHLNVLTDSIYSLTPYGGAYASKNAYYISTYASNRFDFRKQADTSDESTFAELVRATQSGQNSEWNAVSLFPRYIVKATGGEENDEIKVTKVEGLKKFVLRVLDAGVSGYKDYLRLSFDTAPYVEKLNIYTNKWMKVGTYSSSSNGVVTITDIPFGSPGSPALTSGKTLTFSYVETSTETYYLISVSNITGRRYYTTYENYKYTSPYDGETRDAYLYNSVDFIYNGSKIKTKINNPALMELVYDQINKDKLSEIKYSFNEVIAESLYFVVNNEGKETYKVNAQHTTLQDALLLNVVDVSTPNAVGLIKDVISSTAVTITKPLTLFGASENTEASSHYNFIYTGTGNAFSVELGSASKKVSFVRLGITEQSSCSALINVTNGYIEIDNCVIGQTKQGTNTSSATTGVAILSSNANTSTISNSVIRINNTSSGQAAIKSNSNLIISATNLTAYGNGSAVWQYAKTCEIKDASSILFRTGSASAIAITGTGTILNIANSTVTNNGKSNNAISLGASTSATITDSTVTSKAEEHAVIDCQGTSSSSANLTLMGATTIKAIRNETSNETINGNFYSYYGGIVPIINLVYTSLTIVSSNASKYVQILGECTPANPAFTSFYYAPSIEIGTDSTLTFGDDVVKFNIANEILIKRSIVSVSDNSNFCIFINSTFSPVESCSDLNIAVAKNDDNNFYEGGRFNGFLSFDQQPLIAEMWFKKVKNFKFNHYSEYNSNYEGYVNGNVIFTVSDDYIFDGYAYWFIECSCVTMNVDSSYIGKVLTVELIYTNSTSGEEIVYDTETIVVNSVTIHTNLPQPSGGSSVYNSNYWKIRYYFN